MDGGMSGWMDGGMSGWMEELKTVLFTQRLRVGFFSV